MKLKIATVLAVATLATGALAESHIGSGDVDAGDKVFRKCRGCHSITDADGNKIVKGGPTGPNLYGVIGRQAGTFEGFTYSESLIAAGEKGLVWDEATFVDYVQDPKAFLKAYLDDAGAKAGMNFRLKKGMEDVYAYLASLAPMP